MAVPLSDTSPSSVQNLMNSLSRRSMVSRGVLMIETRLSSVILTTTLSYNGNGCVRADHVFALEASALGGFAPF